jgi:hypothetical protein
MLKRQVTWISVDGPSPKGLTSVSLASLLPASWLEEAEPLSPVVEGVYKTTASRSGKVSYKSLLYCKTDSQSTCLVSCYAIWTGDSTLVTSVKLRCFGSGFANVLPFQGAIQRSFIQIYFMHITNFAVEPGGGQIC